MDSSLCLSDGQPAPNSSETCNLPKCAEWEVRAWEACNVECGKGQQKRKVECKRDTEVVSESECEVSLHDSYRVSQKTQTLSKLKRDPFVYDSRNQL